MDRPPLELLLRTMVFGVSSGAFLLAGEFQHLHALMYFLLGMIPISQ